MKKILAFVIVAAMALTMASPVFADPISKNVLNGTPELDGKLDDMYKDSASVKLENPNFYVWGDVSETDSDATAYFLWDDSFLYYCVEVKDSTPIKPDESETWQNDAVEMWFDDGEMKYKIHSAYDGAFFVGGDADGDVPYDFTKAHAFQSAISGGYCIEVALPFNNLKAGRTFVATLQVDDITTTDHEAGGAAHGYQIGNISGDEDTWTYTLSADKAKSAAPAAVGYDSAEAAAAAAGKNLITGYTYVEGSEVNFGSETASNLWDGDVETKYCTAENCNDEEGFPAWSVAKLPATYNITGFTMATANDNESYIGRNPLVWQLYVSSDGTNWTVLASGDDTFFDDVNFTYFVGDASASNVSYVKFNCEETDSGTMQVSEINLFGDLVVEAEAPAPAAEAAPAPAAEAAAPAAAAPAPAAAAAPAAAPVAEAAPAAAAPAAQTGDNAALIVLAAVAALGTAVIIGKRK